MSFVVQLTSLHHPSTPAVVLATLNQYADLSIKFVKNAAVEARVTMSMFDALAVHAVPFRFALKIQYNDDTVFWAQANAEDDFGEGTILITSGMGTILQHHYVRIGDPILDITDPDTGLTDEGWISADGVGLVGLLDCAQNTTEQDDAEWPVMGIVPGDDITTPGDENVKVERGMEVLSTMTSLSTGMAGIDFEFVARGDAENYYATVEMYDQLFSDKSDDILFAYNVPGQPDNIASLTSTPNFPSTVAHALDQPPLNRQTSVNGPAAATIGAWVQWEATDIKVDGDTDASVLQDIADAVTTIYGWPLPQLSLELRPDAGQTNFYGRSLFTDFTVGTIVTVMAAKGARSVSGKYQITEATIGQSSWRSPPKTAISVVPWSDAAGAPSGEDA